jgi:hypothetical protein
MKFEVRDGEKGELEVKEVKTDDGTRDVVAKAVVLVGLALLVGGAAYAMFWRDDATVRWIVGTGATLVATVIGYYFKKPK